MISQAYFPAKIPVRGKRGFTLIELLIVIAIILILISIALPNFLEAQMRARVTKSKAEIRTIALALEQYYLDFKVYPAESEPDAEQRHRTERGLFWLTSPIKYLSTVPRDPFIAGSDGSKDFYYETGGIEKFTTDPRYTACTETWAVFTRGPDLLENQVDSANPHYVMKDESIDSYSPTNGTRSLGDIFQYGGDSFWIGVTMQVAYRKNYSPASGRGIVVDHEFFLHRLPHKLR